MVSCFFFIALCITVYLRQGDAYAIPNATVDTYFGGLKILVPDERNVTFMVLHGKIFRRKGSFPPKTLYKVMDKINNQWIYENKHLELKNGDRVVFVICAIQNDLIHTLEQEEIINIKTKLVQKKSIIRVKPWRDRTRDYDEDKSSSTEKPDSNEESDSEDGVDEKTPFLLGMIIPNIFGIRVTL